MKAASSGEVHADIRFWTKKSLSNQNLPYIMLKISFPFLYASTSPDTNTFTIASDHNFETVCQFVVLLLSTFCGFSIFATGFAFGFGNFAQYCVVLFTCLQWVTFPKKSWPIIIDVRKSWSIVIDTRRSHCPIDLRFQEVSNLLVWCELFANLYLGFDFKRITTTLSEFIGHIDLTDFVQFCLNIPGIMANKSVLGNFDTWNICQVASIYRTRLAYT